MPLYKNTNQPYFPDPNSPNNITCAGDFCYPINQGDVIYQQWYQTACNNNEIVDPTFADITYGANLVTNGTFNTDLTGWTSVSWAWDTGMAEGPVLTSPNSLYQSLAISTGLFYRVRFDLAGLSAGDNVRVTLGDNSAGQWLDFYDNGSIDVIMQCGNDNTLLTFSADSTNVANALIDNVVVELMTPGAWDGGTDWVIDPQSETACATGTGVTPLTELVANYIVANSYYKLSFTISGYGGTGTLTPTVANIDGDVISANGDYEMYLTPTAAGVMSFTPTATFEGCISNPVLLELRNDYLFEVIDEDGNRYDISSYIEYYEDKVTLADPVFDLLELTYDCYTIEVTDRCLVEGIELITDGTFANGDYTNWSRNNGQNQYNMTGTALEFIFDPLQDASLITNGSFTGGTVGWTLGAGWAYGTDNVVHTPGSTATLSQSVTISAPAVPPSTLQHWIQFTISGWTVGTVTVTLGDKTSVTFGMNDVVTTPLVPTVSGVVTFSINPSSTFDGTIDSVALHEATIGWSGFVTILNTANADIVAGNYAMTYDITNISGSTAGTLAIAGAIQNQTSSTTYETTVATHNVSITGYVPGGQRAYLIARFRVGNNYYPGTITVDNVTLVRVEPFEATYTSECMNYKFEHENTKLVTGWCDQESFGFDFDNTDFLLQMRMKVRSLNPIYNKTKNVARYGTGNAAVSYADQTKYWQLATDLLSESAHDALSTIIDCDHFTIGTSTASAIEYIAEAEDYQPQWVQSGSYSLAPIVLNVRLKTGGQKFNRHT